MSLAFLNEMQRNMKEDAALTEQRPRQPLQEDRTPGVIMSTQEEADEFQQTDGMNFIFDGLMAVLKERL